jgi:geranylgeranyl diphosphate synthase type I
MKMSDIIEEVKKRAEIINKAIEEFLPIKEPEGLYKASRHLIKAGGKRLRPVLTLISCEAINRDWRKILPSAVAIETIHNFTLIHDDIMDRDEFRRGVPTVHKMFGEPTAILAGDTLFAEAFKILAKCEVEPENLIKAVDVVADVCVKICEGQYLDMEFEKRDFVTVDEYLEMVEKKTAVLIACSCSLPAILFGEDKYADDLWKFGLNCGIGFQIHDDVLDLVGSEKIGKDWGSDLVEGKKTLVILKAMEMGVEIEIFGKGKASKEEIAKAVEKLKECGAIDYASKIAKDYVEKGKKYIESLPNFEAKELLKGLADYLVTREY